MNCVFASLIALAFLVSCTKVPPGYVGIKVNQYGSQRGVEDFPIKTGRVWYNPFTEDVEKFPTFLQSVVWSEENGMDVTFNSVEGAVINADVALSYGFVPELVPNLFVEFRKDAEEITRVYMKSQVRDAFSRAASTMHVTDIFGPRKQEIQDQVLDDLRMELGGKGFRFDMVSFVGGLRVDPRVQESINATISATQRAIEAQNKVVQATAEARQAEETAKGEAKAILEVAKAQAEANRIVAASLTPELVNWQAIQMWDGKMPMVTGSGAMPMIQLGK